MEYDIVEGCNLTGKDKRLVWQSEEFIKIPILPEP